MEVCQNAKMPHLFQFSPEGMQPKDVYDLPVALTDEQKIDTTVVVHGNVLL
jgi:hypothetical protein